MANAARHPTLPIHADALAWLESRIGAAVAGESDWPQQVSVGIAIALEALAEQPRRARLLLGDPISAGPRMEYYLELLTTGFSPGPSLGRRADRGPPPPGIEAALVGGMVGIVGGRVRSGAIGSLPTLAPALTEFALCPYLGAEEARRLTLPAARFERAFADLRARIEAACATENEWPARAAAGMRAVFDLAMEDPRAGRCLSSEALARGEAGKAQHRRVVSYLADLLRSMRPARPGGEPATVAEDAVAGGVALLVGRLLDAGRERDLPAVAAEATELILIPHLGPEEARRIAASQSALDS